MNQSSPVSVPARVVGLRVSSSRASIPPSVAMRLVGHKTESIYRRYAIVAKQDLVDDIKRLSDYRASIDKTPAEQKVVEMKEAAR
jgi:hypothetical protein